MHKAVLIQRYEGLALLAFSLYTYNRFDLSWGWFIVLLFSYDISILGYVMNKKLGAVLYNLFHSLPAPLLLWVLSFEYESTWLITISLTWLAHIGIDRSLGYGLKLDKGFTHTHLGLIGSKKKAASKD